MYCGDETGAFIGDVGSETARFGFGGEDAPKCCVSSAVYSSSPRRSKYSAPVSLLNLPPELAGENGEEGADNTVGFVPVYQSMSSNCGVSNATKSGLMDVDAWACLWEYSFQSMCVRGKGKHTLGHRCQPDFHPDGSSQTMSTTIDHPLLAVDSTGHDLSMKDRESQYASMLEVMFEALDAPAAYIAPSSILSAFAHARQTALVVDIGHSGTKVTPVRDGFALRYGSVSSGRGGKWLGQVQHSVLTGKWNVDGSVVNRWNGWGDSSKRSVPPCASKGVRPRYLLRSHGLSECRLEALKRSSFHSMAAHEVMYEMFTSPHVKPLETSQDDPGPFCGYGDNCESMQIDDGDGNENIESMNDKDDQEYEGSHVLPDGTRIGVTSCRAGRDLCRIPELLFAETLPNFVCATADEDKMVSVHKLIHRSLSQILDNELRRELASNIVLVGGASQFPTLDKRLSSELSGVLPSSMKYKVTASKNHIERRYSAFIGGSILSSLGSFQQLWLSKKEYDEIGSARLAIQRFKQLV